MPFSISLPEENIHAKLTVVLKVRVFKKPRKKKKDKEIEDETKLKGQENSIFMLLEVFLRAPVYLYLVVNENGKFDYRW